MKSKKKKDQKAQTQSGTTNITNPHDGSQRMSLSDNLINEFARFYEYHPAKRLSRNLRSLILEFLMYDGSAEAEYLRELMIDCDGLFTLLDVMHDEQDKHKLIAPGED